MKNAGIVAVGIIVVSVLAIVGYLGYWWLAKDSTGRRYDVNTGTQQYQAGLVAQERDLYIGWNKANDPGQKQAIADQFCAVYPNLKPPTVDLQTAFGKVCS
ncbi:hypothetical protein [Mycolicibacterium sphagni]|uniref:hypothetical protein n=1 Tax=Mycolicibacterium sphagni TaxID=1786 RepID=UPI0021F2DB6C|nr:hypothetical protein [Mycolicibacterium sphagni]MCV7174921.1 hypothetical protein [Mycolicibacterium sphagni]